MSSDTITDGEWDDDTLALLKYDPPPVDGPATTSELVLVPGYTQSEWDRRQVAELLRIKAADDHIDAHHHIKPPEVLVREAALILGFDRAARVLMSPEGPGTVTPEDTGRCGSNIYAAMLRPALEPPAEDGPPPAPRRRPSQARKTVTGGT